MERSSIRYTFIKYAGQSLIISTIIMILHSVQHKAFCKRLSKAVQLDSGVAEMLSGDFAHDAVLLKIEQLMKQEVRQVPWCKIRPLFKLFYLLVYITDSVSC